jgi:hypothetical protein
MTLYAKTVPEQHSDIFQLADDVTCIFYKHLLFLFILFHYFILCGFFFSQNINFCTRLDNVRNISSVISENLDKQIDAILLKALGRQYCPISPGNLIIWHETLTLQALPAALSLISQVSVFSTFVFLFIYDCLQHLDKCALMVLCCISKVVTHIR